MNYIGSKTTLLPLIVNTIQNFTTEKIDNFADIFAGTGVVGQYYKKNGAQIISNDIQYYSYIINKHYIGNNEHNNFDKINHLPSNTLLKNNSDQIEAYLNTLHQTNEGFIYNNYSPGGTKGNEFERNYFSDNNAKKCDTIRIEIEKLKTQESINENEYYHLLASLIESIDKVANTASVYGAFLKKLKKSATSPHIFSLLPTISSDKQHYVTNNDANEIITDIEGQVLYLDPPYNHRQYATNYHLLETIAKYDSPVIKGLTGLREYESQKSSYCSKNIAQDVFAELIANARFKYIFVSYNNEGIIPLESISKILKGKGEYKLIEQQYSRYKADRSRAYAADKTVEYIHCVKCK